MKLVRRRMFRIVLENGNIWTPWILLIYIEINDEFNLPLSLPLAIATAVELFPWLCKLIENVLFPKEMRMCHRNPQKSASWGGLGGRNPPSIIGAFQAPHMQSLFRRPGGELLPQTPPSKTSINEILPTFTPTASQLIGMSSSTEWSHIFSIHVTHPPNTPQETRMLM